MSTLRIFLPAAERADARSERRWLLLERHSTLREGRSRVDDMPRADDVEVILPAARVLFARLKLPRVNDTTIRELLPFAVEDRLLADPSQIHAVAGVTLAQGDTVVAVVDREWLDSMLRVLAASGRTPRRAWCESALVPVSPGEWHVVLRPDSGVLVDDADVATTFDWQADAGPPLALRIALDEAATRGDRPRAVIVHEDLPSDPREASPVDLARWSADAAVALERGAPWRDSESSPPPPGAIDLLSGEFAPHRTGLAAMRVPRAALAVAAAIALLQVGFTALDTWRLQRERATLEARREAIFRTAFPEARVVVDPDLQMARNLAQMRAARGLATDDDFLGRLTAAARESSATAMSVDYAQGRLTVRRAGAAR
ncbi:MAG TPA: type II secretion system protein GspL [Usitatibacter sp.]|jgi:general secretion pathway protein L|nr:type II secretion system protein GspL [Usitatibacter sp.]